MYNYHRYNNLSIIVIMEKTTVTLCGNVIITIYNYKMLTFATYHTYVYVYRIAPNFRS